MSHATYEKAGRMEFFGPAGAKVADQESRSKVYGARNLKHEVGLSATRTAVVVGRLRGPAKMSMRNCAIDVETPKCIRL
jgi:hypothetical protein